MYLYKDLIFRASNPRQDHGTMLGRGRDQASGTGLVPRIVTHKLLQGVRGAGQSRYHGMCFYLQIMLQIINSHAGSSSVTYSVYHNKN